MNFLKVTGTLINYYFHCKKQCWLHGNRINLEDNSEDVHIGRVLHELKNEGKKNTEIKIDDIKIDKITEDYVVEIKKSDADIQAAKWQLLLYLKVLKDKGIIKKGKLEFIEKNKQSSKIIIVELDTKNEKYLDELIQNIKELINSEESPEVINDRKCKKCAFYEYCYI